MDNYCDGNAIILPGQNMNRTVQNGFGAIRGNSKYHQLKNIKGLELKSKKFRKNGIRTTENATPTETTRNQYL